jgi:hypothetical protein
VQIAFDCCTDTFDQAVQLAVRELLLPSLALHDSRCSNAVLASAELCRGLAMRGSDCVQVSNLRHPTIGPTI